MKKLAVIGAIVVAAVVLGACHNNQGQNKAQDTYNREQNAVSTGLQRMQKSQQLPTFDWSQVRQTLIDVETIQAQGVATTSVGYSDYGTLIWWCPSIGSPVASTTELTPTQQYVDIPNDGDRAKFPVDQAEPTGVYPGQSNGTWVICTDNNGKKIGKYWEGPVDTTVGVVGGLPADKRVKVDQSTFDFTNK